ncbi:hypothetical protein F5Y18DRAFT_425993 [Xylariaceae sp. FL1019]|nr:hypothetical protein F5Y18DRAFT_425993 [Xylariaceae sp. FL1019]
MSDPLSWLKLGSRTPTLSRSPASSERVSERQHGRQSQASDCYRPETELLPITDEDHRPLRVSDWNPIWYNPMVETLQAYFMSKSLVEPIPVEYNAYVLHMIEGFRKIRGDMRDANRARDEAKVSLEQNLEQIRQISDEWLEREEKYQAEVKRLEVLLSKTSRDGLEAVTLARTHSIVDRSRHGQKSFASRLKQLIEPKSQVTPTNPKNASLPLILNNDNDFLMSEKIRKQYANAKINAKGVKSTRPYRDGDAIRELLNTEAGPNATLMARGDYAAPSNALPANNCNRDSDMGAQGAQEATESHLVTSAATHHGDDRLYSRDDLSPSAVRDCRAHHMSHPSDVDDKKAEFERSISSFSFELGDDTGASFQDPGGNFDTGYLESAASGHSLATDTPQRHAEQKAIQVAVTMPFREYGTTQAGHSSVASKHTGRRTSPTGGVSPSVASSSLVGPDSPTSKPIETNARIAATRALANAHSTDTAARRKTGS